MNALETAARASVRIAPENGIRPSDPLRELIPGDGLATRGTLDAVERITGRKITRDYYQNTAPAARATLRRWAMREGGAR